MLVTGLQMHNFTGSRSVSSSHCKDRRLVKKLLLFGRFITQNNQGRHKKVVLVPVTEDNFTDLYVDLGLLLNIKNNRLLTA
jgi:hypothetical protein